MFHCIITTSLITVKDECIFFKAMLDKSIPTNDKLDDHLLVIYVQRHHNDTPQNIMPQKDKFPSTNPDLAVVPPTYQEWKNKQNEV